MIELLVNNWRDAISIVGLVLSIVGTILTVYFSSSALNAAKAAEKASNAAKSRMNAVSWSIQFNELIGIVDELIEISGDSRDWKQFHKKCTHIRSRAAVADSSWFNFFDEETKQKLKISATQFAHMAERADTFAETEVAERDITRLRRTLSEQRVLFSICFEKLKHDASGGENV